MTQTRWVAEDSPDSWAIGEGAVIGASIGAKLAGSAREGQCVHCWGHEQGQCGREIWGIRPGVHGCSSWDKVRARGVWPTDYFGWCERYGGWREGRCEGRRKR